MKCGNCKNEGVTVQHVKSCYDEKYAARSLPLPVSPLLIQSPEEGVFYANSTYYKVQQSEESGRFYAKAWDQDTNGGEGSWKYEGRGPLTFLRVEDKVTAELAARFGHVTSRCVFCSKKLTDERSIAVGYGEICAGHHGLPWGEIANTVEALASRNGVGREGAPGGR